MGKFDIQSEGFNFIDSVRIVLLLVSPGLLASSNFWDDRFNQIMQQSDLGKIKVVPIFSKPVDDIKETPLHKLQALPRDGRPISKWGNADEALVNITKGIRQAADEIASNTTNLNQCYL
ncbi:MAG: hypothetical protein F6J93_31295 [Oscillatoria sp. SIO1A7]|nr:hypothetical protein [Oscillatoria sp. SIO1A7]